jgi:hypothetical protein
LRLQHLRGSVSFILGHMTGVAKVSTRPDGVMPLPGGGTTTPPVAGDVAIPPLRGLAEG